MKIPPPALAAALLAALAGRAAAQAYVVGDAWLQGRMTAGTTTTGARMEVMNGSATAAAFQVSGVDLTPFLVVASSGDAGLGVTPAAHLDLSGAADVDNAALILRNGNLSPATGRYQLTFGQDGTVDRRHAIRSIHADSLSGNALDFLVWTPAQSAAQVGSLGVLSLVTVASGTFAASFVHVRPATGTATTDLVVSDGSTLGGGTVHRYQEVAPSSRELKTGIVYLDQAAEDRAAEEVLALKPVRFRYKRWTKRGWVRDRREGLHRGLIYEETPAVLHGPGKSLVIDERVAELELAARSLIRRLEADDAQAKALGGTR